MRGAVNPWAAANAAKRKAEEALERAREPVIAYYLVPKALHELAHRDGWPWVELASAADVAGCRILRMTKREFGRGNRVGRDEAAVYEGAPGRIFTAAQGW